MWAIQNNPTHTYLGDWWEWEEILTGSVRGKEGERDQVDPEQLFHNNRVFPPVYSIDREIRCNFRRESQTAWRINSVHIRFHNFVSSSEIDVPIIELYNSNNNKKILEGNPVVSKSWHLRVCNSCVSGSQDTWIRGIWPMYSPRC